MGRQDSRSDEAVGGDPAAQVAARAPWRVCNRGPRHMLSSIRFDHFGFGRVNNNLGFSSCRRFRRAQDLIRLAMTAAWLRVLADELGHVHGSQVLAWRSSV